MLPWAFLTAGIGGFVLMIAFGPQVAIFASFGALFGNFATFCLLYNGPADRARARVAMQLSRLQPNTDAHQRLESATIRPTREDRRYQMNAMTTLNLATGVVCVGFLAWGLLMWMF